MADMKPEATAEAAAPAAKARTPLFSTTAWVVIIGIFIVEGVIFAVWKFAKTGDSKAPPEAPAYWTLDPAFDVTIKDKEGFHGFEVKISLGIDRELWKDEKRKKEEIEDRKPKVRDVILTVLQKQKWPDVVDNEGQARLKTELLGRMQDVLGKTNVQEVLFESFSPRQ